MTIDFLQEAKSLEDDLISWRRDFHRYPELGFEERRTARIVAQELESLGMEVKTGIAHTGVIGLLKGANPGSNIMVRLDMDALPIQEENNVEYASKVPGVMHACGHDGHMAIGLGVARIFAKLRGSISGSVKFVFQPAEEGLGGAITMIKEGVLHNPKPDIVLGLHLINDLPLGTLVVRRGPLATSHDRFICSIFGKGAHGAKPELAQDPVVAAGYLITTLQTVVSRNISPLDTGVVTVATMQAEGASNIIPGRVDLTGTIRTFDEEVRKTIHQRVREIVEGVTHSLGCSANLEIENINPAIVNDPQVASVVHQIATTIVGAENVDDSYQSSGSDDVAFFLEHVPGCVFYIGSANDQKGLNYPGHSSRHDFDEHALVLGCATLAASIGHYVL